MPPNALSAILDEPTTIHFVAGTDKPDLCELDLEDNPKKTHDGFIWTLPNGKTEPIITLVGKVTYDVIGDKSGPYFNLPGPNMKPRLEVSDLAKMKTGFAIRFLTEEIDEDKSHPEKLFDHNRAALAYLWDVQEAADKNTPNEGIKPFLKKDRDHPFFIVPVVSNPLFPQFKGTKSLGAVRARGQRGRMSLNPNETPTPSPEDDDPKNPRVLFSKLSDPSDRYRQFKMNTAYCGFEMNLPPVFDINGNYILPSRYETAIPDGTLVAVRGLMKMYNIYPTVGSHSRPYNIVIQRMQIIGGEMTSWDTSPKKRPHDSSQSGPSKRPFSGPGPSGLQSSGGDQMIA